MEFADLSEAKLAYVQCAKCKHEQFLMVALDDEYKLVVLCLSCEDIVLHKDYDELKKEVAAHREMEVVFDDLEVNVAEDEEVFDIES